MTTRAIDARIRRAAAGLSISSAILVTVAVAVPNPVVAGVALGAGAIAAGSSTYMETGNDGAAIVSGTATVFTVFVPMGGNALARAGATGAIRHGSREAACHLVVGSVIEGSLNAGVAVATSPGEDRAILRSVLSSAVGAHQGSTFGMARSALGVDHLPLAARITADVAQGQATAAMTARRACPTSSAASRAEAASPRPRPAAGRRARCCAAIRCRASRNSSRRTPSSSSPRGPITTSARAPAPERPP